VSNQNLRTFTAFNLDHKSSNRPRTRRSSAADIINKGGGTLNERPVLISNLLHLQVLTLVVFVLLIFFLFYYLTYSMDQSPS
jgi:hypothetical protein